MSVYRTPMVFIFVAFSKPFPVVICANVAHARNELRETIRRKAQHDVDQFNDANDDILAPPRLDKCVELSQSEMSMLSRFSRTMSSKFFTEHDVFSYFGTSLISSPARCVGRPSPRRSLRRRSHRRSVFHTV